MAIHIEIHPDDEKELFRIRRELLGWRYVNNFTQRQVAQATGHSDKWIHELEQGMGHPFLSSLQDWAGFFDLRVQPELRLPDFAGFTVPEMASQELYSMWEMAKPFEAAQWVRMWCVAELTWERHWRGIPAAAMSRRLGLSPSAVSGWERDAHDPLVSKLFTYARALGGDIMFHLIERSKWNPDDWGPWAEK